MRRLAPPILLAALPAVGALDNWLRPKVPYPLPGFSDPGAWILRHGPNTYGGNYAQNNHEPSVQWNDKATEKSPPWGPETGKISRQAISAGARKPLGSPVPDSAVRLSYWISNQPGPTAVRFSQYIAWYRPSNMEASISAGGVPVTSLQPQPIFGPPDPFVLPPDFPIPDPHVIPPGLPVPLPRAVPSPRPSPSPTPQPAPPVVPNPGLPGNHPPRPPREGEKENKSKLRRGFDRVMDIFGEITEIADIMDAAWDALPESCRTATYYRGRVVTSAQDRWADVYRCAPHMDIDQFIRNLINNHVEDLVIGWQNRLRTTVLPDGIDGIDVWRWIDKVLFDGELLRHLDLSDILPEI